MKKRVKISLITTVLNESENIEEFLQSILSQSVLPDEFIIVDGGSVDSTYEILKRYAKKYNWIKVFQVKGATIGKGRNYAIKKVRNKIIAVTDAGCILDKKWLEEITKPFFKNKNVDVVVGIYKPLYTNDFEYFQGLIVVPKPEEIFKKPSRWSSRSIAFKKEIWKKIGGYPDLVTGEDTKFNLKLVEANVRILFTKKAVVYWRMRKNWKEFAKQFYRYGVGDRKSGNVWKMRKNLIFVLGFWTYVTLLIVSTSISFKFLVTLSTPLFLYFSACGIKFTIKTKKLSGVYYGFLLMLIKRMAYVIGVSLGK